MKSDPQPDWPELWGKWELSPDVKNKLDMLVKLLQAQEKLEKLGLRLPRVLLFGNAGVDKMEIATALSAASGKPLVAAHARELKSRVEGESSVAIRKLFERAHAQAPCVLFIQDIDLIASKRGSPSNDERTTELMNELLLRLVLAPEGQVLLAASADKPDDLDSAVHLRFQIKIDLCRPWQSLVLRPSVKEQLVGVLRSIQSNAQGFNTLIYGPPGTGKTAIIRDLAESSGLRFLSAGPLDLRAGYVGQTEMRVKAAFDKARNSAPVIFFIDLEQGPSCLLPPRGSSESDSVTHELVCAVLAQMDSLRGKHPQVFFICETFDIDRVDPAVVSRFDVRIELPLPDESERRLIVEQMLQNSGFSADFDVNEISALVARSLPRASGRDLDHCIRSAIQHATQRSSNGETVQLTTSDLISTAGENMKNVQIEIIQGNITTLPVDAIVNAANSSLLGGGGVDGAIHHAAGPQLFEECRTLGGCATGEAKITKGYRLPAKFIIHTVGPVYQSTPEDAQLLANCYRNSLRIANERQLKSIAFPSISTGAFGYPLYEACRIALRTTREMFESGSTTLERVVFVTFSYTDFRQYEDAYKQILADT